MEVLAEAKVEIMLQYIKVSNQHNAHLLMHTILYVNDVSIKKGTVSSVTEVAGVHPHISQ